MRGCKTNDRRKKDLYKLFREGRPAKTSEGREVRRFEERSKTYGGKRNEMKDREREEIEERPLNTSDGRAEREQ